MRTLAALGVTATIELAPAGTLTALIRRELPDGRRPGACAPPTTCRRRAS